MAQTHVSQKTKTNSIKSRLFFLSVLCLGFFITFAPLAQARVFDPNNIITDNEMFDPSSLSKTAIQTFLQRENSVLANFTQVVDGETKTAAQMIWEVSNEWNVNPKFILTTLEKEQGLVSRSSASQKALDWATGYSCFGGTCRDKHKGFYNQIAATAETQKIYQQKAGQFSFRVGQTTTTHDDYDVTPQNQATANLYIYTPHVGNAPEIGVSNPFGANKLFWRIWHRYFSSQPFLDGQILAHNGSYYLIDGNEKRKFASRDIFLADYKDSDVINVSSQTLAAYPNGPAVEFKNNTLVKSAASGQVYLLTDNQKRLVLDNAALALLSDFHIAALTAGDVPSVDDSKLDPYQLGSFITSSSEFPQGTLLKDPSGIIWLVKDGLRHEVDPVVWSNRYDSEPTGSITSGTLNNYPTGEPVKLKDGTFVLSNGNYYLISDGARMRIADIGIFDRVFGTNKRTTALPISSSLLNIHNAGEIIDYIDDTIQDPPPGTTSVAPVGNYDAKFDSLNPETLILTTGQQQQVTVDFINTGSTTWSNGNVWLEATDRGAVTSSFGAPTRIDLNESSVQRNDVGSFTFTLTAPADKSGLLDQEFTLYRGTESNKIKVASVAKFIIVKNGTSAQVLEHNIPIAVRNEWKPVTITMKIKNTSPDTTWLSRRTALELYTLDGSSSPFYDPNDWVRAEVVGVPLNDTEIAPGEVGEFTFTLDSRGVKEGFHILNFQLKLLDKDKEVFIDGAKEWHREIRVD